MEIFSFLDAAHDEMYTVTETAKYPWSLTQVCRLWRHTALSIPHLWARLHIPRCSREDSVPLLRLALERSRPLALSISGIVCTVTGDASVVDAGLLEALLSEADRWKDVHLMAWPILLTNLESRAFPQLTKLHLSIPIADIGRTHHLHIFSNMPALQCLTIEGSTPSTAFRAPPAAALPLLREIHLLRTSRKYLEAPFVDQHLHEFFTLPRVRRIRSTISREDHIDEMTQVIVSPVETMETTSVALFGSLFTPQLKRLHLGDADADRLPTSCFEIMPLVLRSGCTLTTLHLYSLDRGAIHALVPVCRAVPTLEELLLFSAANRVWWQEQDRMVNEFVEEMASSPTFLPRLRSLTINAFDTCGLSSGITFVSDGLLAMLSLRGRSGCLESVSIVAHDEKNVLAFTSQQRRMLEELGRDGVLEDIVVSLNGNGLPWSSLDAPNPEWHFEAKRFVDTAI